MNDDTIPAPQRHSPSDPKPSNRRNSVWLFLLFFLALTGIGAGAVYEWPEITSLVPALGRDGSGASAAAGDNDKLPDLIAIQQKTSEDLERLSNEIADQQEKMKSIVEQLAALTSKIEALQSSSARQPVTAPISTAPASPPAVTPAPSAPAAAPSSKKPPSRVSHPQGPISTGGAPLTASPDR